MNVTEVLSLLESFDIWADDKRQKLTKTGASTQAIDEFSQSCEQIRTRIQEYVAGDRSRIKCVRVETLQCNENLFRVVRFRAAHKGYSGATVSRRDNEAKTDLATLIDRPPVEQLGSREDYVVVASYTFGEADAERHIINTIPTTCPAIIARFQQSGNNPMYSVTGVLLPNPINGKFELFLFDLKALSTPLDLTEPTTPEMDDVRKLLAAANGGSLLPELRRMVCESMRILDPGDPLFTEAMDVTLLQAASHGRISGESARIHDFVMGPPGIGKGVLSKIVRLVQPIFKKVEPQAITEDGLYGNSGLAAGKRIVRAGLIPQAHQGAFIIEDFHQANSLKNQRLVNSFTATMETGRCEAANASRASYAAEVAFHVDSNRLADVDERKTVRSTATKIGSITADTGMPKNVLTRFDYIVEFERDITRQLQLVHKIACQPIRVGDGSTEAGSVRLAGKTVGLREVRRHFPHVSDKTIKRDMMDVCGSREGDETWRVPAFGDGQATK